MSLTTSASSTNAIRGVVKTALSTASSSAGAMTAAIEAASTVSNLLNSSTVPSNSSTTASSAATSTTEYLKQRIQQFDFNKTTSSAGMSELMRRLYRLRIEIGIPMTGDSSDNVSTREREMLRKLQQVDKFEYTKAIIMQQLGNIKVLLEERRKDLEDALSSRDGGAKSKKSHHQQKILVGGNETLVLNRALVNQLRKLFKKVHQDYEQLKHLQYCAQKRLNGTIWNLRGGLKPTDELLQLREQDLQNIRRHIERAERYNRTLMLFSNNQSGGTLNDQNDAFGSKKQKSKKKKGRKSEEEEEADETMNRNPTDGTVSARYTDSTENNKHISLHGTVSLVQESIEWSSQQHYDQRNKSSNKMSKGPAVTMIELNDFLSKDVKGIKGEKEEEEALPTVDISIGLEQIRRNGVNSLEVQQLLNAIEEQVNQMKEMAHAYKSELEVHCKLLSKMERDVDKYEASLQGLNSILDKGISKLGGEVRLFCCAFFLLVVVMSAGVVYFAVTTVLNNKV